MPTVIVTNLSPGELLAAAVNTAQSESAAILDLANAKLADNEALTDRLKVIAKHAIKLAEAFMVIDSLASSLASSSEPSPVHRGVRSEGDPTTN